MNRLITLTLLLLVSLSCHARFLGEDPSEGDIRNPPSLHKYLYAYQNPTVYVDPDGRTAEQNNALMSAAVEKFRTSPKASSRKALGDTGELALERILRTNGEILIKGPSVIAGQGHNADIVSYDPETKQISFFDNKVSQSNPCISRANCVASPEGRERSIQEAMRNLKTLDIDVQQKREIKKALMTVQSNPTKAIWAVANASAGELSEVDNRVSRVSQRLADRNVLLANVLRNDQIEMLTGSKAVNNGRKIATKVGKALPAVGLAVTAATTTQRVDAATQQDTAFRQAMQQLGITSTTLDNHSLQRELAIIAGEEAGGEGGGAGGAAAAAPFSAGCGLAAPLCLGVGAVVGGLAGDTIGGKLAERTFDENARQMVPAEIEHIKQQIRQSNSKAIKVIAEDPSRPGSM